MDKRILAELQDNFPLSERPYDIIAARVGVDVEEVFKRVCALIDGGVIRRMGASLDSRKLGFSSTLAVVRVPAERIDQASAVIAEYQEATHSYLRDGEFNIWFTLIAADEGRIGVILDEIRESLSLEEGDILNLPMERLFKLDARFKAPER